MISKMHILCIYYIYNYGQLLSFAGGRFIAPASENAKNESYQKFKKLKAGFFPSNLASPARSNYLEQMRL